MVKMLGAEKFDEPKTVICISNVCVWGDTPPKQVEKTPQDPLTEEEKATLEQSKAEEQPAADAVPENPPADGNPDDPQPSKGPKFYKQVPLDEAESMNRRALPQYEPWKNLETLFLTTGMKRENLNVYVLCAGVLYGLGETVFGSHFKSAWLENPPAVACIGDGQNLVPTIHVTDLCRAIKFVVETKPETHYILAIDNTSDRTQMSIVRGISEGIGTGEVTSVQFADVSSEDWAQKLTLNLWLAPSKILIPPKADDEDEAKMPFDYHCLTGLRTNIRKLNEEYNRENGLRPVKIFVTGPPASGKTHYGRKLAEHYNVPLIQVAEVVAAAENLPNDLGERIRSQFQEQKSQFLESESKKAKPKGYKSPPFKPRLSDDLLAEAFRWRLSQNHCRNRGFVLDGWPRTYEDAERLFVVKVKAVVTEEGGEPGEEKNSLDREIFPENVIVFREPPPTGKEGKSAPSFLLQRVKSLPEELISGTHYTEDGMARRTAKYREANMSDKGIPAVQDFYARNGEEVFSIDCSKEEIEAFESLRIYIEREGRPLNFLTSAEELKQARLSYLQEQSSKLLASQQFETARKQAIQHETRNMREMKAMMQFEQIKDREVEIKKAREMPLRDYLMENVIPALAEGLLEVCRVLPDDPVDYLAEYLFKHSSE